MKKTDLLIGVIMLGLVAITFPGCARGGLGAADVDKAIADEFNTVDTNLALWKIQPGLGTVMIEYDGRFDNLWYAAQDSNWDMVKYQILEMREIQEVGETTRPNRAPMLKAFESGFLEPLDKGADAKDLTAFVMAYDNAIGGCNACHAASSSTDFSSYKFVKIIRPAAPHLQNVDWNGGK